MSRNYLETILDLPWSTSTSDTLDLTESRKILDTDHYGMEKVKKRVLEFLAVRQLNNSLKGMYVRFLFTQFSSCMISLLPSCSFFCFSSLLSSSSYSASISPSSPSLGPILCFVGAPGVGKTSVGRSIAKTLGRKFHRISLGGSCDQSDIRGHRRTYIGSMPGRIIQGLKVVGVNNPVFLLDEVDKLVRV